MLSSAKKRTITLTHQRVASKLHSLLQTQAVRLPKRGYPAQTHTAHVWNKHNAVKGQAAISLPHKLQSSVKYIFLMKNT